MLNRRTRDKPEVPLFGDSCHEFSAREVMEATVIAADTIRWSQSAFNVESLAKAIGDSTKGNIKQETRSQMLEDIADRLVSMDFVIVRRRVVPDVISCIKTHSAIPKGRKDKALNQWRSIIGQLDRILG